MIVNDINLNIHIEGEGIPILLLHGFPDSHAVWRKMTPLLVQAGYKVIAPDLRGFGQSDAPKGRKNYTIERIMKDIIALLDKLQIDKAHLVGHDWGAMIGWFLAGHYSNRFYSYTAISVGHPKAYATAGWAQKRKSTYILIFQLRGIAEKLFKINNWAVLRKSTNNHPEIKRWIEDLSRTGRLTAGMNWYRANLKTFIFSDFPRCTIPTMGVWPSREVVLLEEQMRNSQIFVDDVWRYERLVGCGHWALLDAPKTVTELILDFINFPIPGTLAQYRGMPDTSE
tara:strand:- start:58405 stop:59253 length:849 start_codon:yes stop_codon:yes gene_type:complete